MGRGPRESIVDQKLTSGVLLLLGVGRGVVLVGLVVLTVVVRMLLLLVGKGLLQQNLLAVVMAGATGAGAGCIAAVAAAAVCAVRNHLRCASGVCLILQCKITKVVERPGVHYRGRHSPGSSFCLQVSVLLRVAYDFFR